MEDGQRTARESKSNAYFVENVHDAPGESVDVYRDPEEHAEHDQEEIVKTQDELSHYVRRLFLEILEHTCGEEIAKTLLSIMEEAEGIHDNPGKLDALYERCKALGLDEAVIIASCFSNLLMLQNCAESVSDAHEFEQQRVCKLVQGPEENTMGIMAELIDNGLAPEEVFRSISTQTVDLVFTAHPTQTMRRSQLRTLNLIRKNLYRLRHFELAAVERFEIEAKIKALVQSAWRTDEINRSKPTPQDEMLSGLSYFQETIFDGLPKFLRRIDSALAAIGQPKLPLSHTPIRFSSWMGGDRDGNPFVDARCTRDVVNIARTAAVDLYCKKIEELLFELSMWRSSKELRNSVEEICGRLEDSFTEAHVMEDRKRRNYADFWQPIPREQPYRVVLAQMRDRLYNTRELLHFRRRGTTYTGSFIDNAVYTSKEDVLKPLMLMYTSLCETGDQMIAEGNLLDFIRQVQTFGLNVFKLDIRQESDRHTDTLDTITTWLGLGSYKEWPEERRIEWLIEELNSKRPLISSQLPKTPETAEVLDTFGVIAEIMEESPGSLSTYVISMATSASDVLAVKLLMRECGTPPEKAMPVAPLFERLQDLQNAPAVMDTLFQLEWYRGHIDGYQQVMIGYSDSGKDAGRMAAAWALYEAQESVAAVSAKYNIATTLFHGRGGSVGRGGGPSHLAILSQPPHTVNGSLRVTVQGEVIEQMFGHSELCMRTLDLFTAATLKHTLEPPQSPKDEWREVMKIMSETSCDQYRKVVFQDPRFINYFRAATPEQELGRMNIGSRPAKRKAGGVETLRAIPWMFAWTQNSFNLPVWLGVGAALKRVEQEGKFAVLKDMYDEWPFFRVTVDLLEVVLAKSEKCVTKLYDRMLVEDPELKEFSTELFKLYDEVCVQMLKLNGQHHFLEHGDDGKKYLNTYQLLRTRLALRSPYVAPLNVLQVVCLRNLRELLESGAKPQLYKPRVPMAKEMLQLNRSGCDFRSATEDTLLITIRGISAGVRNTG